MFCMCKKIAKLLIIKLNEQDLIKKLYISFFFQQFDIVEKIIRFIELLLFIISGVTSTVKYWTYRILDPTNILKQKCFFKATVNSKNDISEMILKKCCALFHTSLKWPSLTSF